MKARVLVALLLAVSPSGFSQSGNDAPPFTERTAAYFVHRYGSASASWNSPKAAFLEAKHGNVEIKGPFTGREFKNGDLRVKATFFVPSLKLAAVKLQLSHQWTIDQIQAALAAYGTGWKETPMVVIRVWTNPDGLRAIYGLSFLEIQSPAVAQAVDRAIQNADATRKAIPNF